MHPLLEPLQYDPIPPDALQAVLDHLIDEASIPSYGFNSRGQTWLAEQIKATPRTVRRWLAGDRQLSGLSAEFVRWVLADAMGESRKEVGR